MTNITKATIVPWLIILQSTAKASRGQLLAEEKFSGTLPAAKAKAISLRQEFASGQKDVVLRIQSDAHGTVSACMGNGQSWEDSEQVEGIGVLHKERVRKENKKALLWLVIIIAIIAIGIMAWRHRENSIKNYSVKDISETCQKWTSISDGKADTALPQAELDAIYNQCRNDIVTYTSKHGLKIPSAFLYTAERKRQEEELEKVTVYQGMWPNNWRAIVKTAVLQQLKDPDSAKVSLHEPELREEWKDGKRYVFGVVPVTVNAKNSYGGYVGNRLWLVYFRDGTKITSILTQ